MSRWRRRLDYEVIEPRLLLSGDALGVFAWDAQHRDDSDVIDRDLSIDQALDNLVPKTGGVGEDVEHEAGVLIVVDANVDGYQELLAQLSVEHSSQVIEVLIVDSASDGLDQLDQALGQQQVFSELHIIAHGSDGGFQLGSTWVTESELTKRSEQLSDWREVFADDADIFIYGCDLAASESGRALIDVLSALTATDVAASDDRTGSESLGGDWEFEYRTGDIESSAITTELANANWDGVLATVNVTTTADVLDGDTLSISALFSNPGIDGFISLREAVIASNNTPGADVITLGVGTYDISRATTTDDGGDFDIRDDLSIIGESATTTIIKPSITSSVIDVHGDTAIDVSLRDLKIENGVAGVLAGSDGGALRVLVGASTPTVHIDNVWFSNNVASGLGERGGSIFNAGRLVIESSLIEGGDATAGGGLYNATGASATLSNVTFSDNTAGSGGGGAIHNVGAMTLNHVTVNGNSTTGTGGGLYTASGTLQITNSIVAGNAAASGADVFGVLASGGSNIFGNSTGGSGYHATDQLNVDPLLSALGDQGGSMPTHGLNAGSSAIDAGTGSIATDGRGFVRGDATVDIGAFEASATASPVAGGLWLSTTSDVVGGGQSGTDTWTTGDLISLSDPGFALEPGISSGTFSIAFDVDLYAPGAEVNAAHIVSTDMTVGTSSFALRAGDLLLSTKTTATLTSNAAVIASGFAASVNATRDMVIVFRPESNADYSTGSFQVLLDDVTGANTEIRGISLVESDTVVGDVTLSAGDFLYTRAGGAEDSDVWLLQTTDVGSGTTTGTRSVLLAGGDAGVSVSSKLFGIELLEQATRIGGHDLAAGTLLLAVDASDTVGSNALAVSANDVFAINVAQTTLGAGSGMVSATLLLEGADLALDSTAEELDAIAVATTIDFNDAPVATIAVANYTANEDTALALQGTGLSIADVDAGTSAVQARLSVGEGTLSAVAGSSGVTVSGAGSGMLTLDGTVAAINALLSGAGGASVSYQAVAAPSASTTLTLSVDDLGNSGSGGAQSDSASVALNVTAVNDAPVATIAVASYTANEDTALALQGTGLSIADVDAGTSAVQARLSVGEGTLSAVAGSSGVTVSGAGSGMLTLDGTVAAINALLSGAGGASVSYQAVAAPSASTTLTLSVDDLGNSGSGGAQSDSASVAPITRRTRTRRWRCRARA